MSKQYPKVKVTQIWSQNVANLTQTNLSNFWGLGDLIRGAANMHAACCEIGLEFELDYSRHPISNIFTYKSIPKEEQKEQKIIFLNFNSHIELIEHIKSAMASGDGMEFMSNGYRTWNESYVEKFRDFIMPRLLLKKKYDLKANKLLPPHKSYDVLHFRLGDSHLIEGSVNLEKKIIKCLEKNITNNTFLITDSVALKKFAIANYNVDTLPISPCHSGLNNGHDDQLFNTQLEFMLMGSAKSIKTYSVYSFVSGFAKAASFVYDIPLMNLKQPSIWNRSIQTLRRNFMRI